MMLSALKTFFTPSPRQQAHNAYLAIVTQARRPVFYQEWQVADTMDGRFDIIVLHLFLVLSALEAERDKTAEFARTLSETFFSDMDRSLRELGVGDTGISIRVKKMAQAFYGRAKAYTESVHDAALLQEALRRNVYREEPVTAEALKALVAYALCNRDALRTQSIDALMQGDITFLS